MQHELIKYIAVVEAGSFTDAAERLRISQPALSMAIMNLEKQLGHELIVRSPGVFQLTDAGRLVYEAARQMRLGFQDLQQRLEETDSRPPRLRVGMIDSVAEQLFSSKRNVADALEEVVIDNSSRLIEQTRLDRVDMALITEQLSPLPDDFIHRELGYEPFVALASRAYSKHVRGLLHQNKPISLLAYNADSNTFGLIERSLTRANIAFRPVFFSTEPRLLIQAARNQDGVAIVPSNIVPKPLKDSGLTSVEPIKFRRGIWSVHRQGRYLGDNAESLLADICKLLITR